MRVGDCDGCFMSAAAIHVPWVLEDQYAPVAAAHLQDYFREKSNGSPAFTGAVFQSIGGSGDAPPYTNIIRAEDALAVSALSVTVPPLAAARLLDPQVANSISDLLERVPADCDLVADGVDVGPQSPAAYLWKLLRTDVGLGVVTTSKLLARKRPRIMPIYDSVVAWVLCLKSSRGYWEGMQAALRTDGHRLHTLATELSRTDGVPAQTSALRVIDVVLWMHGQDLECSRALAVKLGAPEPPPEPNRPALATRRR